MNKKLTKKEIEKLRQEILKEVNVKPPTIGVIGVSGVGKSSTLNSLFKTNLATSDTVACTKEFRSESLKLEFQQGYAKNEKVSLVVIDAPGLGEDIFKDPEYWVQFKLSQEMLNFAINKTNYYDKGRIFSNSRKPL